MNMNSMTDSIAIAGEEDDAQAELVEGLRCGEAAAFEVLMREHGGHMMAVARRFMRDEQDAADAMQDALICVYRKASQFHGGSKLSTWLHRITVNACLM